MEDHISAFLESLQFQEAYSESTRMAYASDLRVFIEHLQNTYQRQPQISDLNASIVASFLDSERVTGSRHNTLVRRLATLRRFSSFLQQKGLYQGEYLGSGTAGITDVLSGVPNLAEPAFLEESDLDKLLAVIEASPRPRARRDQAILLLLLETGLSVGSLVALNMEDLNPRNGLLHLKMDKGSNVWLELGKASEFLEKYIEEGRPDLIYNQDEPALFVSQMGGRISRQGIWQILRHWGQKVTPAINLSPRLVRHTAALRMSRSGKSIHEIHTLLGHSNMLSTRALVRRLKAADRDPATSL